MTEKTRRRSALDEVDLEILRRLRSDGRVAATALAEQVHVSRANLYDRLGRMEQGGIIRGYGVDADPAAVGLGVTAVVLLRGGQRNWRHFREELSAIGAVEYAALVMGDADAVVIVRCASIEALRDLLMEQLQRLPGITSSQTLMVMDEVVHRPFVLPGD